MPLELRSFLFAVSAILALVLFVPCIESILNLVRRNSRQPPSMNWPTGLAIHPGSTAT